MPFFGLRGGTVASFQCYKVAIRYIQYNIAYTVLGEVIMQIVKRGTKSKSFLGRNEEDDQPGRYLQHNPEKTNNGIHLKVE